MLLTQQPGFDSGIPKNVLLIFSMSLGFIDGASYSKVHRGLKMSILNPSSTGEWHASTTK